YANPNAAADALVATRYRGCRISRLPASKSGQSSQGAGEGDGAASVPPGHINRAAEPEAFARAINLAGWGWKADWKACIFPEDIAAAARAAVVPGRDRLRVVEPST